MIYLGSFSVFAMLFSLGGNYKSALRIFRAQKHLLFLRGYCVLLFSCDSATAVHAPDDLRTGVLWCVIHTEDNLQVSILIPSLVFFFTTELLASPCVLICVCSHRKLDGALGLA